jgi:hypothetical protein
MVPSYWVSFLDEHRLRDAVCEVSESQDLSQLGGFRAQVYDEKEILMEATEAFPAKEARPDGFVPIACGVDFDALFFINESDGKSGPLYRLFCDGFPGKGYYKRENVELVLPSYEQLLAQVTRR